MLWKHKTLTLAISHLSISAARRLQYNTTARYKTKQHKQHKTLTVAISYLSISRRLQYNTTARYKTKQHKQLKTLTVAISHLSISAARTSLQCNTTEHNLQEGETDVFNTTEHNLDAFKADANVFSVCRSSTFIKKQSNPRVQVILCKYPGFKISNSEILKVLKIMRQVKLVKLATTVKLCLRHEIIIKHILKKEATWE